MHERSVTRAAEKLFLGQPADDAALSRLRNLFDDPLFVRTGRSMEPTARAIEATHCCPRRWTLFPLRSAALRNSTRPPAPRSFASGCRDDVICPHSHAAQTPGYRGAWHCAGGAAGELHPDAARSASGEISVGVSYTNDLPVMRGNRVCCAAANPNCCAPIAYPAHCRWMTSAPAPTHWCHLPGDERGAPIIIKSWKNSAASATWCWPFRSSTA